MVAGPPISTGTAEASIGRIADRRARHRIVTQWPLRLWRMHEHVVDTDTVNVSSAGFYCVSSKRFYPGETLIAVLEIPAPGVQALQHLLLRCEALVLRVETIIGSCNCGIACRIINYSVLRSASVAFGMGEANAEGGF